MKLQQVMSLKIYKLVFNNFPDITLASPLLKIEKPFLLVKTKYRYCNYTDI